MRPIATSRSTRYSPRPQLPRSPPPARPAALAGLGARRGENGAGDATAAVPARVCTIVVGAGMDHQAGAIRVRKRTAGHEEADRPAPVGTAGKIGQVAGVRALRVQMPVLSPRRVPMRAGAFECRAVASPDRMQVKSVIARRQTLRRDPEIIASRARSTWTAPMEAPAPLTSGTEGPLIGPRSSGRAQAASRVGRANIIRARILTPRK